MKKLSIDRAINALMSGRYHKGRNRLETEKGNNCCLGVFAHEMGVEFSGPKKNRVVFLQSHDHAGPGSSTMLPSEIVDYAPWIRDVQAVDIPQEYRYKLSTYQQTSGGQSILAALNDGTRQGFVPIVETLQNTKKRLRREKSKK